MRIVLMLMLLSNVVLANEYYPPLIHIKPVYPKQALEDCIEGFVTLSYMIGKDYESLDIEVVKSEPKGIFEKVIIKNFKRSLPDIIKDKKLVKGQKKRSTLILRTAARKAKVNKHTDGLHKPLCVLCSR